jgi:F1F0 ATPase subunit 2
MNDILALALDLLAGLILGAFFFGGLLWTIRKGVSSDRPALWFFGSFLFRLTLILAGFYLIARSHRWQRLVTCLVGFVMARLIVTWLARPRRDDESPPAPEKRHAT